MDARLDDMLDGAALESASECLRTIAHPVRIRVIELLLREWHTVGALAEACGVSQSAMSTHLRILSDRGLLRPIREGRSVYYEIAEPGLASILDCIHKRYG
ncbi:MAG: winged helix-turn-helix transcriptional regulator [Phycisphaerales bacterium]|nr:winged helix-turn-helix transcriptional regulator [Phycisphaerales bacterium]